MAKAKLPTNGRLYQAVKDAYEKKQNSHLSTTVHLMRKSGLAFSDIKRLFHCEVVIAAYLDNNGNQCQAARELEMHRNTFARYWHEALRYLKVRRSRITVTGYRRARGLVAHPNPPRLPVASLRPANGSAA